MGRSPPFGSAPRNSVAHFGLAFATPPGGFPLGSLRSSNSPAHYAKGTQSVVSTRRPTDLLPLVGTRFQVLFHSPSGVLFTFPSRYWFAIGLERVFSLTRWSSRIHAGFLGSRITWETAAGERSFSPTGLSPSLGHLSRMIRLTIAFVTPGSRCNGLLAVPSTPMWQRLQA